MTFKSALRALSLTALATLAVVACGGGGSSSQGTGVGYGASQPKVTISFWYMPNGAQPDQYFKDEAAAFERAHPNIVVQGTNVSWSDALTKITAAVTSGVGPDVTQLGTTWVGTFSKSNGLHSFSQAEIDGLGGPSAFAGASWKTGIMQGSSQVTAIPWFIDTRALFYRTDVLKNLGIDPATAFKDWSSFEATLAKIKAAGQIAPFGIPGKQAFDVVHNIAPWVWNDGGDYVNKDGTQSTITEPGAVDGVNEFQTVAAKYIDPAVLQQNNATVESLFAQGKFAITVDNPSLAQLFAAPSSQGGFADSVTAKAGFATAPYPAGPKGDNVFFGGSDLGIMKSSKNEAAAYEWVRWLSGDKGQESYVPKIGLIPARTSAANSPAVAQNQYLKAFVSQLPRGRGYPVVAAWGQIESALVADFGKMFDAVAQTGGPLPRSQVQQLMQQAGQDVTAAIQQSQ